MLLPKDFAAPVLEWQILFGMLVYNETIPVIDKGLNPNDFTDHEARELIEATKVLYRTHKQVDLITLTHYCTQSMGVDICKTLKEIRLRGEMEVPKKQIPYYIDEIKKMSKKRKFIEATNNAQFVLKNEGLTAAKRFIYDKMRDIQSNGKHVLSLAELGDISEVIQSSEGELISSGFSQLDKAIVGFRKGQYVVIAGRPSSGKTAITITMMHTQCKQGYGCAYFSFETSASMIIKRLAAMTCSVNIGKMLKNELTDYEKDLIRKHSKYYAKYNMFIIDKPGMKIADMYREISALKDKSPNLSTVIVDHFSLIKPSSNGARHEQYREISLGLKMLVKEFDITIMNIVQLGRDIEYRSNTAPTMGDLRETGSVEEDADIILAFHNRNEKEFRTLRVLKCKEGEKDIDIRLGFKGECMQFSDPGAISII